MASELVTSSSRTDHNLRTAKAKALSCLHQEHPKLTALEKAFWHALRRSQGTNTN